MKLLIILLTSTMLSGCFWQSANHSDLQKAAYFCKGIESIEYLEVHSNGNEKVRCLDGSQEYLNNIFIGDKDTQ